MKTVLAMTCLAVFVLATAFAVRADIARPKPSEEQRIKTVYAQLEIVPDSKALSATLQIHRSDLKDLLASVEGAPTNTSFASSITHSGTRTIIAGMLLFLSLSFAGVWLARASRSGSGLSRSHKAIAVVLVAIATIGTAAIITRGNAGPPPSYAWRNLPTNLTSGRSTRGSITISLLPDDPNGGGAKLIMPVTKKNERGEEE
ncbi:MAG TPA: hypothetical protein VGQ39_11080 [Pyrinomonadaceae bacterium]|nr:hypothetical protein [Pyrinomonadaceae bacterium]